ncbi:MAG: helix-turn-helix domain-containing protein [Dongiaceae bacterium]
MVQPATASVVARSAEEFGAAVRDARRSLGLTQRKLALAVGTGERFIVELERGKGTSHLDKALKVAAALGLRVELVLGR